MLILIPILLGIGLVLFVLQSTEAIKLTKQESKDQFQVASNVELLEPNIASHTKKNDVANGANQKTKKNPATPSQFQASANKDIDVVVLDFLRYTNRDVMNDIETARPSIFHSPIKNIAFDIQEALEKNYPYRLIGQVKNNNNVAISGIKLTATPISNEDESESIKAVSDRQGLFSIDIYPEKSYQVCSEPTPIYLMRCATIELKQSVFNLTLQFAENVTNISGVIQESPSKPISGVDVEINSAEAQMVQTRTDFYGRYNVTFKSEAGEQHKLFLNRSGFESQTITLDENIVNSEHSFLDITLTRKTGYSVYGKIVSTKNNQPVKGQMVSLFSPSLNSSTEFAQSNDIGEFVILNVKPADDYQVTILKNNFYESSNESFEIIEVSENIDDLVIKVVPKNNQRQSLALKIIQPDGLPFARKKIILDQASQNIDIQMTDVDGKVYFDDVPQGKLSLYETSAPLVATNIEANIHSDQTIQVGLGKQSLEATVIGKHNEPVICDQVLLRWQKQDQNGLLMTTDRWLEQNQFGQFKADNLSADNHQLMLRRCKDHKRKIIDINIGEKSFIEINLEPIN